MNRTVFSSPLGYLEIVYTSKELINLHIALTKLTPCSSRESFATYCVEEIENYFKDPGHKFSLPFKVKGTDFQKRVWKEIASIHLGQTLSYGKIAEKLCTSPRAVGNACRQNPLLIVIPCHRVIGHGTLGGFNGTRSLHALSQKTWLLKHEGYL